MSEEYGNHEPMKVKVAQGRDSILIVAELTPRRDLTPSALVALEDAVRQAIESELFLWEL